MADSKRERGRPKQDVTRDQSISIRLTGVEREALTEYRRRQSDLPSEAEVLRGLLEKELKKAGLL